MILSRTYASRSEIPRGAEALYVPTGSLFILRGAKRDFVADNPWEADNWNLTAQGRFIAEHGAKFAEAFARNMGTKIGGLRPRATIAGQYAPIPKSNFTVIVQRKGTIAPVGGGGLIGAGSSGSGAPK
jgi:hypothetical protein